MTSTHCIFIVTALNWCGSAASRPLKDVVMLAGFQEIEFDFVAENLERTLFHCHQQLHMDFGFMALFDYA
jgi:FtsP/CotA-like multicopper oxidase with cupredoxin domain